jgi:hypothetical protein
VAFIENVTFFHIQAQPSMLIGFRMVKVKPNADNLTNPAALEQLLLPCGYL